MTTGLFAISCFTALMPVFVRDVLHASAYLLGATGSMIGLGSIAGAFAITRWTRRRPSAGMVSLGMAGIGAFIFLLAAFVCRAATLVCSFGIGASVAAIVVTASALLQGETPLASSMALMALAQAVALMFAGGWAERFGIVHLFQASAGMLFAVALGGMWRLRRAA
jgi:hypothetical protein